MEIWEPKPPEKLLGHTGTVTGLLYLIIFEKQHHFYCLIWVEYIDSVFGVIAVKVWLHQFHLPYQ
jgi:hypothetical protein